MENETKQVVISGIRATGKMHLGNYIGAIKNFVKLSKDDSNQCFYFIANLHTLTTKTNPEELKRDLHEIVMDYLSAGIDPDKATIYAQSSIPETCELTWLLACITNLNDLVTMPHFKDKKEDLLNKGVVANAGLLIYPVLMAADILGIRANIVPVGQDQHAHVELTRSVARRFNSLFGEFFPIPELLDSEGVRVPSLDKDGKMGKSDSSGVIYLSDQPAVVASKIKVAVTDPQRQRRYDPGDPSVCNIFTLHQILSIPEEIGFVSQGCRSAKIGCTECKSMITKTICSILIPLQESRKHHQAKSKNLIDEILHEGGKKAQKRIVDTVNAAKDIVGVPYY